MANSSRYKMYAFIIYLYMTPHFTSTSGAQSGHFSRSCVDGSRTRWKLLGLSSMTRPSRLRCASKCVGTKDCRAYDFDGGECRFLKVVVAGDGDAVTACDSLVETTYLMQPAGHRLCPFFSRRQAAEKDDGEGQRTSGECVCPEGKRGEFCQRDYQNRLLSVQPLVTVQGKDAQHVTVNGRHYLFILNYMEPERLVIDEATGNTLYWQAARPKVYRYIDTTHQFLMTQMLDPMSSLSGIATFVSAGNRYVVVKNYIYLFNNSTGLFERQSTLPEMSNAVAVSALKRASGEVVFAFANPKGMSMTVTWSDESPPTVSKAFLAVRVG